MATQAREEIRTRLQGQVGPVPTQGVLKGMKIEVTRERLGDDPRFLRACLCQRVKVAQHNTSHVSMENLPSEIWQRIFLLESTATKALASIMRMGTVRAVLTRRAQHKRCMRRVALAGSSNTPDNGSNILGATPATSSVKDVEGGMSVVPGSVAARVGARPTMLVACVLQLP